MSFTSTALPSGLRSAGGRSRVGGALGLAALTTVSATAAKSRLANGATAAAAHSHGYGRALLIVALVSLAGALTALFFGDSVQPPPANTTS